jgi:hypothetical protein
VGLGWALYERSVAEVLMKSQAPVTREVAEWRYQRIKNLVGADENGAKFVEVLGFGWGECAIVDADVIGFVVLNFPRLV